DLDSSFICCRNESARTHGAEFRDPCSTGRQYVPRDAKQPRGRIEGPRSIEPADLTPRPEECFVHELFRFSPVPDHGGQVGEQEEGMALSEVLPSLTVAESGMLEQSVVSDESTHRDRVASRSRPPTCGHHRSASP